MYVIYIILFRAHPPRTHTTTTATDDITLFLSPAEFLFYFRAFFFVRVRGASFRGYGLTPVPIPAIDFSRYTKHGRVVPFAPPCVVLVYPSSPRPTRINDTIVTRRNIITKRLAYVGVCGWSETTGTFHPVQNASVEIRVLLNRDSHVIRQASETSRNKTQ